MTPNKDHIRLWVEALRSGKYEQGREQLKYEDQFCCLGVACDISGLGKWQEFEGPEAYIIDDSDRSLHYLPRGVYKWLGLGEFNPTVLGSKRLSVLNDDGGYNFSQIADVIESTFLMGDDDAPSGE